MGENLWGLAALRTGGARLFLFVLAVSLFACQKKVAQTDATNDFIPTYQAPEVDYCSPISLTGVTITGSAGFEYRNATIAGLGIVVGPKPIRYAEVRVTNAAGTLVQCTETDGSGNYSFIVPASGTTHRVTVTSRSNNSLIKAYVYDDPRTNTYYSISTTFTPDSSKALSTMTALATGTTEGGAFNILDQFLEANDYLRAQVGSCSTDFPSGDCQDFVVADRVTAYWKLGFSPAAYYSEPTVGLSFYLPGYSRLFILGGIEGDSETEDTDHYDNSVILHEYGHFLEDTQFQSESPGGSHDGDAVVDPRLAWSEGWGNFFQAAVRGTGNYVDTRGYAGGAMGTSALIYVTLENQTIDVPRYDGEGNFREFSVTRLLWDAIDSNSDSLTTVGGYGVKSDTISNAFNQIYYVLSSPTKWRRSSVAYRQIGHLHFFQSLLGTASWDDIVKMEGQSPDASQYGYYVSASGTCDYTMNLARITLDLTGDTGDPTPAVDDGSDGTSHWVLNNNFFHLRLTSTQSVNLVLNYTDLNGGSKADLDLILWNQSAEIYYGTSDAIARSEATPTGAGPYTETISRTLSAGNYLIDVRAYTGGMAVGATDAAQYYITLNGSRLCPASYP